MDKSNKLHIYEYMIYMLLIDNPLRKLVFGLVVTAALTLSVFLNTLTFLHLIIIWKEVDIY